MMSFGDRVKLCRKEHGLTQEQLGEKIGVTKVSISGYESENRSPDLETLQKLAIALEVSIDYLVTGTKLFTDEEFEIANYLYMRTVRLFIQGKIDKNGLAEKLFDLNERHNIVDLMTHGGVTSDIR